MGVREEIESLKSNIELLAPMFQASHGEDAKMILETYNEAIDDALSILDEHLGEYVAEAEWIKVYDQDQFEEGWDWMALEVSVAEEFLIPIHGLAPGDRIAIHKIKAKINWPNKEQFDRELANYPSMKEE